MCFDAVRVIVPCGNGELTVCELIERAVSRYRKASNKASVNFVKILFSQLSIGVIRKLKRSSVLYVNFR